MKELLKLGVYTLLGTLLLSAPFAGWEAIHTLGDRENLLDSTNRPVLIRRVPTRFVVESKQGAVPMDLRGYPPPFPLGAYPPLLSLLHTPGAGKAPVYRTNGCLVVSASAGVP